jgi:hypothetical protein
MAMPCVGWLVKLRGTKFLRLLLTVSFPVLYWVDTNLAFELMLLIIGNIFASSLERGRLENRKEVNGFKSQLGFSGDGFRKRGFLRLGGSSRGNFLSYNLCHTI